MTYNDVNLQLPPGTSTSSASCINASGEVAGFASIPSVTTAVLWSPKGAATVLSGNNISSYPEAINASGETIGVISLMGGGQEAALWSRRGRSRFSMTPAVTVSTAIPRLM